LDGEDGAALLVGGEPERSGVTGGGRSLLELVSQGDGLAGVDQVTRQKAQSADAALGQRGGREHHDEPNPNQQQGKHEERQIHGAAGELLLHREITFELGQGAHLLPSRELKVCL
jgi:hypothetical protein